MSPIAVIILIIVILVVVAAIAFGVRASRRKKLQNTFGPEYDRVVADTGNRTDAEKELRERERRHAELELKPLSPESQARYSQAWEEVQIQFVDNPEQAVNTADDLVTRLIAERGYPTGDYDERLANLSVEHARTLGHYRDAHEINLRNQKGEASTEDLRQALVHYRALFADLLGTDPIQAETAKIRDLPGTPTAQSAATVGPPAATDAVAASRTGGAADTIDDRLPGDRVTDAHVSDNGAADDRFTDGRVPGNRAADDRVAENDLVDDRATDGRVPDSRATDNGVAGNRSTGAGATAADPDAAPFRPDATSR